MNNQKVLVITGGSSGIGKAAAELFADKGYTVYNLSRHGEDSARVHHISCDVTRPDDCRKAIDTIMSAEGYIDVMISNAGMGISGAVEFTETDDWKRQMDVNFNGAVNITQAVLPHMRKCAANKGDRQAPKIIFTSSMAAVFPIPYQAFYTASKFAINGFAMALRNELRPFGIEVSCLLPGDVKTGFTAARKESIAGSDVYTRMERAVQQMAHDEQNGQDPIRLARKMYSLAESRCPSPFSTVGLQYKLFRILLRLLPTRLVNRILYSMY